MLCRKNDLAKAGAEAAMQPFAELIQKIAGPAAEEIGLTLRDHVRFFRMKRRVRLMERTDEFIKKKGIEPHRVPLKMLATVVENATLEDDDSLQDMWAALLANAATAEQRPEVMLAEILRQLSPADAHLLKNCFQEVMRNPIDRPGGFFYIKRAIQEWNDALNRRPVTTDYPISGLSVENLTRLGLISSNGVVVNGVGDERWLTKIGYALIYGCEDPAEIKKAEEQLFKDPRVKRGLNTATGGLG